MNVLTNLMTGGTRRWLFPLCGVPVFFVYKHRRWFGVRRCSSFRRWVLRNGNSLYPIDVTNNKVLLWSWGLRFNLNEIWVPHIMRCIHVPLCRTINTDGRLWTLYKVGRDCERSKRTLYKEEASRGRSQQCTRAYWLSSICSDELVNDYTSSHYKP